MKTGYKITTDLADSSWYYLDNFGVIHGPVAYTSLPELVVNGIIDITTKISRDKVGWQLAGAISAIGFDCIVMATDEFPDKEEYKKNMDPRQFDYIRSDIIITKLFDCLKANNEMYVEESK